MSGSSSSAGFSLTIEERLKELATLKDLDDAAKEELLKEYGQFKLKFKTLGLGSVRTWWELDQRNKKKVPAGAVSLEDVYFGIRPDYLPMAMDDYTSEQVAELEKTKSTGDELTEEDLAACIKDPKVISENDRMYGAGKLLSETQVKDADEAILRFYAPKLLDPKHASKARKFIDSFENGILEPLLHLGTSAKTDFSGVEVVVKGAKTSIRVRISSFIIWLVDRSWLRRWARSVLAVKAYRYLKEHIALGGAAIGFAAKYGVPLSWVPIAFDFADSLGAGRITDEEANAKVRLRRVATRGSARRSSVFGERRRQLAENDEDYDSA